ncbi:hypothetical protein Vretimale_10749, partial [Volvox reticuliferus]
AVGLEQRSELRLGWARQLVSDGELDLLIVELLGIGALAAVVLHVRSLNNLDGGRTDTVARRHLLVHLSHGAIQGYVTVLFVHVVHACAGLVANPHAVVLRQGW